MRGNDSGERAGGRGKTLTNLKRGECVHVGEKKRVKG